LILNQNAAPIVVKSTSVLDLYHFRSLRSSEDRSLGMVLSPQLAHSTGYRAALRSLHHEPPKSGSAVIVEVEPEPQDRNGSGHRRGNGDCKQ
jgi:hypothetical protein